MVDGTSDQEKSSTCVVHVTLAFATFCARKGITATRLARLGWQHKEYDCGISVQGNDQCTLESVSRYIKKICSVWHYEYKADSPRMSMKVLKKINFSCQCPRPNAYRLGYYIRIYNLFGPFLTEICIL